MLMGVVIFRYLADCYYRSFAGHLKKVNFFRPIDWSIEVDHWLLFLHSNDLIAWCDTLAAWWINSFVFVQFSNHALIDWFDSFLPTDRMNEFGSWLWRAHEVGHGIFKIFSDQTRPLLSIYFCRRLSLVRVCFFRCYLCVDCLLP